MECFVPSGNKWAFVGWPGAHCTGVRVIVGSLDRLGAFLYRFPHANGKPLTPLLCSYVQGLNTRPHRLFGNTRAVCIIAQVVKHSQITFIESE